MIKHAHLKSLKYDDFFNLKRNAGMFLKKKMEKLSNKIFGIFIAISLIVFAFYLTFAILIYNVYKTVNLDDQSSSLYCDKVSYLFTFWIFTIYLSFIGLGILLLPIFLVVILLTTDKKFKRVI